jgi:putative sigma-54 modulation protein
MDIRFSGKNLAVTEGMKQHLTQKLLKFEKYAPRLVDSHVILVKQKYLYAAEITLMAKNFKAYGDGTSKENIFAAIDAAYVRVEKQLKKFREKVKDHHKKSGATSVAKAGKALERSIPEDEPQVIRSQAFAAKPMSTEEASMQLQLSPKPFLVFQNASTKQVNVIFKREDGNHGLIEPEY